MDKKKIEVLKRIDKAKNSSPKYSEDFGSLEKKGYEKGFLKAMEKEGLLKWSGSDFHITEKGENILREEKMMEAMAKPGVFESINKASEGIQNTLKNISILSGSTIMPRLNLPKFEKPVEIKNIGDIKSPGIITEENNWERHNELLQVHEASLKTQEAILTEQKSTSKLTWWILILTIVLLIITGISIF